MKTTATICGSRYLYYDDVYLQTVKAKLTSIIKSNPNITFNIGDAPGADTIAQKMLYEMQSSANLSVKIWHIKGKPRNCVDYNWGKVGIWSPRYTDRDRKMIRDTTLELICLWNGKSTGTKNNIIQALGRIDIHCYIPKNLKDNGYFLGNFNELQERGGNLNVYYA